MKNVNAIDRIISELAMKDYLVAQKRNKGKKPKSYTLSPETEECLSVKRDYLANEITEEEYKAHCLKHILTN